MPSSKSGILTPILFFRIREGSISIFLVTVITRKYGFITWRIFAVSTCWNTLYKSIIIWLMKKYD